MAEPRVLSLDDIKGLADRMAAAAGSARVPRALRADLVLAGLLIRALLRAGAIAGPVSLQGGRHAAPEAREY